MRLVERHLGQSANLEIKILLEASNDHLRKIVLQPYNPGLISSHGIGRACRKISRRACVKARNSDKLAG